MFHFTISNKTNQESGRPSVPECTPVTKRPAMTITGLLHHLLKPIKDPPINTSMVDLTSVPFLLGHSDSLNSAHSKNGVFVVVRGRFYEDV